MSLNSPTVRLVQSGRMARNLLLVRAGAGLPQVLQNLPSSANLCVVLSCYQPPTFPIHPDWWVLEGGLSKFHAAKLILTACPELLAAEQFAFLDPDVEISTETVSALFARASAEQRALYQAALTPDSFTAYGFLKTRKRSPAWHETSFVEVMAPFMDRQTLLAVLDGFDACLSTWGLEYHWMSVCRGRSTGVYNDLLMRHADPVDHADGPFYRYMRSLGVDPKREMCAHRRRYTHWTYMECRVPFNLQGWLKPLAVACRGLLKRLLKRRSADPCRCVP